MLRVGKGELGLVLEGWVGVGEDIPGVRIRCIWGLEGESWDSN